jgi:lipopolysaccharide export system protein LptC
MATALQQDRHSRLVWRLKILLPITAICILSTLFLMWNSVRPEDAIPYTKVDVATMIREPRLTDPVFVGMTSDGAALSLKASAAWVASADGVTSSRISDVTGQLETPDGARTTLTAGQAVVDDAGTTAILTGDVQVTSSTGYAIDSQLLRVALDKTSLDSPGFVTAAGPVGTITAGSMHLGLTSEPGSDYVLLFKDGVTVVYDPAKQTAGD